MGIADEKLISQYGEIHSTYPKMSYHALLNLMLIQYLIMAVAKVCCTKE